MGIGEKSGRYLGACLGNHFIFPQLIIFALKGYITDLETTIFKVYSMVKLVFRREQYELAYASLLFQLYTRAKIGVNLNKNTKPICIGRKTSHLVDFLGKLCSLKHQPIPHPIKTLEICCFFVSFIIDCFYHSFLFHKSKLVTIIPVIILEAAILF